MEPSVVSKPLQLVDWYPMVNEPVDAEMHALFEYVPIEFCWTCELVVAASLTTVPKEPEQLVPSPETPLQQMTLLAYAAVD